MTSPSNIAPREAAPIVGEAQTLPDRLGSPEDLAVPALAAATPTLARIRSLPALRSFLQTYQGERLAPLELPMILRAHAHASRNEARELIALDQQLVRDPRLREYAAASCRVGQRQLNRLRPLRDHRVVQRYLKAVEKGEAHGWHTLVYGVSLAVFSLPLRQGLLAYACRTLGGFIESAAPALALSVDQCRSLHASVCGSVPPTVERLLVPNGKPVLQVI